MIMGVISLPLVLILLVPVLIIFAVRYRVNGGLYRRYCNHILTSLEGKTVLITGGNAGIGRETAVDLARRRARVIIGCRNEERAKAAVREIQIRSGNSNVHYLLLDLSDLESVRKCAEKFLQEESRLDVLINNAGIGSSLNKRTKQGYDLTFGTNHFGHFLLTLLLLDLLKKTAPSRIVTLSSIAHANASDMQFNPGDPGDLKYPGLVGYDRSKLANILFTYELSKLLWKTGVTTYSVHPGLIRTSIFYKSYQRGSPFWRYIVFTFAAFCSIIFGCNEEAGAQPSIYCAIEESIADCSGLYFDNCMVGQESKLARDHMMAKNLWKVSCQVIDSYIDWTQ